MLYEYKVHSVEKTIDGDTVDLIIDCGFGILSKQRVRLDGIDTPESATRNVQEKVLGLETKQFVDRWLREQKTLRVRTRKDADDKYGRLLATVWGDTQECLNEIMVRDGWAWAYSGGKKEKNFAVLAETRLKANSRK